MMRISLLYLIMNTVDGKYLRLTLDHATHCMNVSFSGFLVFWFCFLGSWLVFYFWLLGFLFVLGVFSVCV